MYFNFEDILDNRAYNSYNKEGIIPCEDFVTLITFKSSRDMSLADDKCIKLSISAKEFLILRVLIVISLDDRILIAFCV
jgi:hypothetical protein